MKQLGADTATPAPPSVCMVVHDHYPKDVRVWRAARAATEAGWKVTVICLRHPDELPFEELDRVAVRRLPIEHRPGTSLGRMLGEYTAFTALAIWTLLRLDLRCRQQVVHINNPPDFLMLAAVLPKLRGSKVIFDVHDLTPLMFDVRFHGRRAAAPVIRALTIQQRLAGNFADRVITPHRPSARRISESGIPLQHIGVMMNPPDGDVLERVRATPPARASDDGFLIAYHGTVTHWYGIDLIVDAIAELQAELPDARAIILGDGDAIDQIRDHVRALGLEDRIELSGRFLPNEQALATVRAADCGVVPNLPSALNDLTLSGKLLDYALLGVPAVVARLDVQAEHFDETEVTFFKPGDPHSLAQAIRWVAANPQEARAKAQRARQRAQAYAWPHQRDTYQHLLNELVAQSPVARPTAGDQHGH
jgi:glycosyltransferase involved in cell wall biosynthesis